MKISETFCALPWVHLSTRPNGHMRVCCTANASGVQNARSTDKVASDIGILKHDDGKPANLSNTSLLDAWNNSYMRETRKTMMRGEKPQSCIKCYKEEDAGHRSKRQWETSKWINKLTIEEILKGYNPDTGEVPPQIRYVDLRLGSKCQLACVMCSPNDSSNWIPEHKKIHPHLQNEELEKTMRWEKETGKLAWVGGSYAWHKKNPMFFDELYEQIPTLKQLYWAGGEPLVMKEHYELLQQIIDDGYASGIEVRYNSNGMEWDDNLFDLWKEFKEVIFHFSIDDLDDRLHYIRYPATFDHLTTNMRKLDNYPHGNLRLTTAYTVQLLNIWSVPDFVKWKMSQDWKLLNRWPQGGGMIDNHLAYWPPQLNCKALPQWFKDKVAKKYEEFYPWLEENWEKSKAPNKEAFMESLYTIKRLQGLVSFLQSEDWSVRLPETAEWCYTVAEQRDMDFDSIFPELSWLKDYDNRTGIELVNEN